MFGTIRKHQQWLWIIIIAVIIVSFVVFFSPYTQIDGMGGGAKEDFGTINDKPITRQQMADAWREQKIMVYFNRGEWPSDSFLESMQNEMYDHILLSEKLKELKIQVSTDATADFITTVFTDPQTGAFSMTRYEAFVKELSQQRMSKEDFERFVKHWVGRQHLVNLYGLSGKLVTPQEAQFLYQRNNERLNVEAVFFPASNYLAKVTVNETNLTQFFNQQMAQYRVPEKVEVSYVKFDAADFKGPAEEQMTRVITNKNAVIEGYYRQKGGTNFYKDATGRGLSLTEATPKIMEDIRGQFALMEARKKAAGFITELFDYAEANQADKNAFEKTAAKNKLSIKDTAPFDEQTGPKDLNAPDFARVAFRLRDTYDERYTPSPVQGEDAVYVLALKNKIPSKYPALADVRKEVTDDYKYVEARKLAMKAGDDFQRQLAKSLGEGKTFESICAQQGAKPVTLPAFSLSTRVLPELKDRISLGQLQNAAGRLGVGKSTDVIVPEQGGVAVLYMRSRAPVAESQMKTELPEFTKGLSEQRQYAAYSQWFLSMKNDALKIPAPPIVEQKTN